MNSTVCDDDLFFSNLDEAPCIRGRSQTWSFTRPPKINHSVQEPIRELSVEDIFNEIRKSASEFNEILEEPEELFGFKYEDLSDIEEDVQKCGNMYELDQTSSETSNLGSPENFNHGSPEHRKKTDLTKICGYQSYHHMIEKAISSSPDKQLTLNQIYSWIEQNVPYFRTLTESGHSKGWKNSVRHNLSLHKQFYRVLREGHRSCFWACDMNRIKNGEKSTKFRKILPQKEECSPPAFRPRSKTDPTTMVKPALKRPPTLRSHNEENLVKPSFHSLASRFEAIEAKKKNTSFESIPWAYDTSIKEQCRNFTSFNNIAVSESKNQFYPEFTQKQTLHDSNHDLVNGVAKIQFNVHHQNSNTSNNFITPTTFVPEQPNISDRMMNLDYEAIIDHEKTLYTNGLNSLNTPQQQPYPFY